MNRHRWKLARALSILLRPVYAVRRGILTRNRMGRKRFYDVALRRACEEAIDRFQAWEMKPFHERMDRDLAAMEEINRDLRRIRKLFGLPAAESAKPNAGRCPGAFGGPCCDICLEVLPNYVCCEHEDREAK